MIHDFRHMPAHFVRMNHNFRRKPAHFSLNKPDSQHKFFFLYMMEVGFKVKPTSFFHNGNKMLILPLTY